MVSDEEIGDQQIHISAYTLTFHLFVKYYTVCVVSRSFLQHIRLSYTLAFNTIRYKGLTKE